MSSGDQLEIIRGNGEITFYLLPGAGVTNIGRHPENDLVLDSRGIAPFHAILDHRQKPYRLILLAQADGARVGGLPLSPQTPVAVGNGDKIELDDHVLVLLEDAVASAETQTPPLTQPELGPAGWVDSPPEPAPGPPADAAADPPADGFTLGQLSPRWLKSTWFKPAAITTLPVINKSSADIILYLEGVNEKGHCNIEFGLPGEPVSLTRKIELRLPAQTMTAVSVRVSPLTRRWLGLRRETCCFRLVTTSAGGPGPARSVLGRVSNAPLFGPGLVMLAGLCFLVVAAFILRPLLSPPVAVEQPRSSSNVEARPVEAADSLFTTMLAELRQAKAAHTAKNIPAGSRQPAIITYEEMFREIGLHYNLDWRILATQAYLESRLDPLATGRHSDMGLMQILPMTWNEWAPQVGVSDPYDPYSNVQVAAAYLAFLRDYCSARGYPEDHWMLAAYNWGPDNVRRVFENGGRWEQVPESTRRYTRTILQTIPD